MKKTDVIKLLGMMSAAYPNMKEINEATVEIWYECLKDMSVEEGLAATKRHVFESPYPPTIADIRGPKMSKRTGFHNFKQRSDRYSEGELEEICRQKREKHLLKLQGRKEVLGLEEGKGAI